MVHGITPHDMGNRLEPFLDSASKMRLRHLHNKVGSQARLLATPPGVAGFVMPGRSRSIFLNWYMAMTAPLEKLDRVVSHEKKHLRHQEIMNLEIPFFNEIRDIHMHLLDQALGEMNPLHDLTETIEGFTETATAKEFGGIDPDCPYSFDEVPKVGALEKLVQAKTGQSVVEPFTRMDGSTRSQMLGAMRGTINALMMERLVYGEVSIDRNISDDPKLGDVMRWHEETFPDRTIGSIQEARAIRKQFYELNDQSSAKVSGRVRRIDFFDFSI